MDKKKLQIDHQKVNSNLELLQQDYSDIREEFNTCKKELGEKTQTLKQVQQDNKLLNEN